MLPFIALIVMMNGAAFLHHVVEEASAPVSTHHAHADDEIFRVDAGIAGSVPVPIDAAVVRYPLRDLPVAKLLATSIFHPPQAS